MEQPLLTVLDRMSYEIEYEAHPWVCALVAASLQNIVLEIDSECIASAFIAAHGSVVN